MTVAQHLRRIEDKIDWIKDRLDRISRQLRFQTIQSEVSMATLDELIAKVESQTTTVGGIEVLIEDIKARLIAAGVDTAKVDAAFSGVSSNTDRLDAALLANTPAAP